MTDQNDSYWDNYYKNIQTSRREQMPPTQFATFCLAELVDLHITQVVDIAAGEGRDSIFFAQQGLQVIAIDRNSVASDLISGFSRDLGRLSVVKMDVVEDSLSILNHTRLSRAWYARFFLHTLTDNQLSRFFKNLSSAMKPEDYFFAEYRNEKDKWLVKAMPSHFRNFFTSESIAAEAEQNNLKCIYEIEGRGFAKWGIDDAVVSRQIFVRDGASNGG